MEKITFFDIFKTISSDRDRFVNSANNIIVGTIKPIYEGHGRKKLSLLVSGCRSRVFIRGQDNVDLMEIIREEISGIIDTYALLWMIFNDTINAHKMFKVVDLKLSWITTTSWIYLGNSFKRMDYCGENMIEFPTMSLSNSSLWINVSDCISSSDFSKKMDELDIHGIDDFCHPNFISLLHSSQDHFGVPRRVKNLMSYRLWESRIDDVKITKNNVGKFLVPGNSSGDYDTLLYLMMWDKMAEKIGRFKYFRELLFNSRVLGLLELASSELESTNERLGLGHLTVVFVRTAQLYNSHEYSMRVKAAISVSDLSGLSELDRSNIQSFLKSGNLSV